MPMYQKMALVFIVVSMGLLFADESLFYSVTFGVVFALLYPGWQWKKKLDYRERLKQKEEVQELARFIEREEARKRES